MEPKTETTVNLLTKLLENLHRDQVTLETVVKTYQQNVTHLITLVESLVAVLRQEQSGPPEPKQST
jgi:hypothetical protein